MTPPTLWHALALEAEHYPPLDAPLTAEAAIVGGGFTGLNAALELARAGVSVVLLEARDIGFGASGRNAGFVVPNFSKADPASVIARLGQDRGERLLRAVGDGAGAVFGACREFDLGGLFEQPGWLQPAHSDEMAAILQRRIRDWQALGRDVEWIGPDETRRRTGVELYHGALRDPTGGVVNPLAYARGLARAAVARGARIHCNSPVMQARQDGGGWVLTTAAGQTVGAARVLIATNADATGIGARLARSVVPLGVYQIATEPLSADVIARFSPKREPVSDTRNDIFTFRLDPENRLISGGMALLPFGAEARMARRIVHRLAGELRLPRLPRIEHVWRGEAAVTTDFLPHVYPIAPGMVGAVGCNGRGIVTTTVMGRDLAGWLSGGCDLEDLVFPLASPAALPFRRFSWVAPSAYLVSGRMKDRAGIKKQENANHA